MLHEITSGARPKIGFLTTDELRVAGLMAMLADPGDLELVPLAEPRMLAAVALELLLLDADATPNPVELIASLHRLKPLLRVLVLGSVGSQDFIEQIIGAGARGYLLHSTTETELRQAMTVVREGSIWAPRKILSRLLEQARQSQVRAAVPGPSPTDRELEVVNLLLKGLGNRDIATNLHVQEGTVKAHMGRLMRKASVDNRTALSLRAMELGWGGIPDK